MIDRDLVLAKVATLDRCLARIAAVRGETGSALRTIDVQDITVLNLQRAVQAMTGFRNVAVHEYRRLDPAVLEAIVRERLGDLRAFAGRILERAGLAPVPRR